jgi:integrase
MSELHDVIKKSRNLAPSSRKRYLRDIDQWIAFAGEAPSGWTRERAQAFYDHLLDERELRPQSANRLMASVAYASKWRAHYQNKPELDFAYVQKAKGRKARPKHALQQETVTKLVQSLARAAVSDPLALRDHAMVIVMLETGMRKMSICSMTVERTHLDIALSKGNYPHAWVRMKGTGLDDVAVPLSDTAIAALRPWLAWLSGRSRGSGPVFCGVQRQIGPFGAAYAIERTPFYPDHVNRVLNKRTAEAKIGHIHPHQFRHTFVTWRADAGLAPHEIAAMTGHTLPGLGAMGGYIDMKAIAEKVRNSTPQWLRELVIK